MGQKPGHCSHKAKIKVSAGLGSFLEALGQTLPASSFRFGQHSVPCGYRTEVPFPCGPSVGRPVWIPGLPSAFPLKLAVWLLLRLPATALHVLEPPTPLTSSPASFLLLIFFSMTVVKTILVSGVQHASSFLNSSASNFRGPCDYIGPTQIIQENHPL